jgi:hypothetical protein
MPLPDERLWRRLSPLLDRALELSRPERADRGMGSVWRARRSDGRFEGLMRAGAAAVIARRAGGALLTTDLLL